MSGVNVVSCSSASDCSTLPTRLGILVTLYPSPWHMLMRIGSQVISSSSSPNACTAHRGATRRESKTATANDPIVAGTVTATAPRTRSAQSACPRARRRVRSPWKPRRVLTVRRERSACRLVRSGGYIPHTQPLGLTPHIKSVSLPGPGFQLKCCVSLVCLLASVHVKDAQRSGFLRPLPASVQR